MLKNPLLIDICERPLLSESFLLCFSLGRGIDGLFVEKTGSFFLNNAFVIWGWLPK